MTEASHHFFSFENEKSQEVSNNAATTNSDIARSVKTRMDTQPSLVDPTPGCLDLNTKLSMANNSTVGDVSKCAHKLSSFLEHDIEHAVSFASSRGFGLDLNAKDISSSSNQNPFHRRKNHEHQESGDASECGSTTCPLEEKDPMKVWKEMKQNGFLSSSRGGIPVPKPRGRKSKSDGIKKKMELAKREQVDRFAKIAAPSGLLNELNPGIINHVRNSKQVHSIIEALVRSEKLENRHAGGKQAISTKSGTKDMENVKQASYSHEDGSLSTLSGSQWMRGCSTSLSESLQFNSKRGLFGKTTCPVHPNPGSEDDILTLKLSSSVTMASENTSSLSNEVSANLTGFSSLSVKAANVASQWLDLLHQDTRGRLAALRRSKKRVRAVIQTELPSLMSREFSCNQENDPYVMKNSAAGCSDHVNADVHQARWSALFDQMEKALSEEEKQLEIWLNQVKEMQIHCDRGLQHFNYSALHGSQWQGSFEDDYRLEEAANAHAEREMAVTSAAASIYSTCNFLSSKENLPCFL